MACAFACSTGAAAPSGGAAARATTRSWRSREARCRAQIRITEQGEIISSKYSNPEVGRRNLETLASATLEATLLQDESPAPDPAFLETMEELSLAAYKAYRGLVYETEGFVRYFWASTVITEIASLNIGSRPASRKKTTAIEDLRAIPWVFSLGAVPADAARLVRLRLARSRPISTAHPQDGLDGFQAMYRALAVLPHSALQHGHGDGEVDSPSPRAMPGSSTTLRLREKIFARICGRNGSDSVDAL